MKNRFSVVLIVASLAMVPSVGVADGWLNWKKFNANSLIVEGPDDGSRLALSVTPELTSGNTTCSDRSYLTVDGSSAKGKLMVTVLTTAIVSGNRIYLYLEGCENNRPKLTRVGIVHN
jgi:hypothetical protein